MLTPWIKISLLLCTFGFLKEIRPSEPFITNYLIGPWKNFTSEQVNQQIYAVGIYCYLALLIVVFMITDLLRYKPVIVLLGASGILTWSLLIWGMNIPAMQAVEFFYGFFMAAEVAYYTYIYAKVDKEHYQKVSSHTRTAYLLGRFLSGVVSQALVSTETMDYYQLNFITLAALCCATVWAIFLPPVKHSIYFHRETNNNRQQLPISQTTDEPSKPPAKGMMQYFSSVLHYMWVDVTAAYTNFYVLKWSIWWALATCGFLQCITYIQVLWVVIIEESQGKGVDTGFYNGAVEAAYTLIGALSSLGCGWLKFNWQILGEASLAICSLFQGGLLIISANLSSIWIAYALYIAFGVLYHTMITIANSEVAKHINEDSYGLVFGINTFFALVVQTVLTAVVVGEGGFMLNTRQQFIVYGSYFGVLGVIFLFMAVYTLCSRDLQRERIWLSGVI